MWVIGGGGLLGSAISRAATRSRSWRLAELPPLQWSEPKEFDRIFEENVRSLNDAAVTGGLNFSIVWAAGAANVSSNEGATTTELDTFDRALAILARMGIARRDLTFFLSSSAGGLYAGAAAPPFTELSETAPTSPYGRLKREMEARVALFSAETGVRCVIGRFTNLYGPGQSLTKSQGLITHLLYSRLMKHPVTIYVPLDTVRDYLFIDDAASMTLDSLSTAQDLQEASPTVVTKIFGFGAGTSISSLIGQVRFLTKGTTGIAIGQRELNANHARDLRFRSVVWPHIDYREKTMLPRGFHVTMIDLLDRMQQR